MEKFNVEIPNVGKAIFEDSTSASNFVTPFIKDGYPVIVNGLTLTLENNNYGWDVIVKGTDVSITKNYVGQNRRYTSKILECVLARISELSSLHVRRFFERANDAIEHVVNDENVCDSDVYSTIEKIYDDIVDKYDNISIPIMVSHLASILNVSMMVINGGGYDMEVFEHNKKWVDSVMAGVRFYKAA